MYMFVADRKGLSYEQSKKMHEDLVQYAKSVGLEYNFDKSLVTNSLKCHRLIQFAKTKGLGEQAEERLFYAYFTQGKNLSDVATLIELGKEIGLTEIEVNEALTNSMYVQKVESDTKEAQTLGARAVPFFVINRKYAIAGAQQPNEILKTLEKAFAEWHKDNPNALKIKTVNIVNRMVIVNKSVGSCRLLQCPITSVFTKFAFEALRKHTHITIYTKFKNCWIKI